VLDLLLFLLLVSFAWSLPLEYNFVREFGSKGSKTGDFNYPVGITIDRYQNIFISDWNNYQITKCDREGKFIKSFAPSTKQKTKYGFNKKFRPIGLIATKNDLLYVSDQNNNAIFVFDLNGVMMNAFGGRGRTDGKFKDPRGLATDIEGNVYVADYSNSRIQVFDKNGKFLRKTKVLVNKKYYLPRSLVVSPKGDMWVVLSNGNMLADFSKDGKYIKKIGKYGNGGGEFNQPRYIASDIDGNLYVSDRKNNRIEIFSSKGEYFGEFGQKGKSRGEFNSPEGIWVDFNGNILVVDADNNRIQEFGAPPETAHLYLAKYYESASLYDKAFDEYMELLKYDSTNKSAKTKIKTLGIELIKKYTKNNELEKAKNIYNSLSVYYQDDKDIESSITNGVSNIDNTSSDTTDNVSNESSPKNTLAVKIAIFVIITVVMLLIIAVSTKKKRKKSKKRSSTRKKAEPIDNTKENDPEENSEDIEEIQETEKTDQDDTEAKE